MKKEWGVKNGLNPVTYLCESSHIARRFHMLKTHAGILRSAKIAKFLFEIASRTKKYEGKSPRRGKYLDRRWYDDREWRYVPNIGLHPSVEDKFPDERTRSAKNEQISKVCDLSFKPNDIKYIIIENERQRLSMIEAIETIKGGLFSDNKTVRMLASRIITSKQISEDF